METLKSPGTAKRANPLSQLSHHPRKRQSPVNNARGRNPLRSQFSKFKFPLCPAVKRAGKVTVTVSERKWRFPVQSGFNSSWTAGYIGPIGLRFDNILGRGNVLGWELIIGDRVAGARLAYSPFCSARNTISVCRFSATTAISPFSAGRAAPPTGSRCQFKLQISGNSGLAKYFSAALSGQNGCRTPFLPAKRKKRRRAVRRARILQQPVDTQKSGGSFWRSRSIRDQKIHPLFRLVGAAQCSIGNQRIGQFRQFYRFTVDVRRYQPLWKKAHRCGANPRGAVSEGAPFYEKFYLQWTQFVARKLRRSQFDAARLRCGNSKQRNFPAFAPIEI